MIRSEDARELFPHEEGTDKWILPETEEPQISEYLPLHSQSKELQDAKLNIDSAYLIPSSKKQVRFNGVGYLIPSLDRF